MKTLSLRVLAPVLLSALIIPWQLAGQGTTKPKKESTPEQQETQAKFKSYLDQRKALQEEAAEAFNAEMARANAGHCKNATNTREAEICLDKESAITQANYTSFGLAIFHLLSLTYPAADHGGTPGQTGKPPDTEALIREFDSLQTAWQQYEKVATTVANNQYKGGTHAPVFSIEVFQELARSNMRELNLIYDGLLHR